MKGIDISSNNGSIDFTKVKASGVEIVYIKATEGIRYTSPVLLEQCQGAKAQGLKIGFYHYLDSSDPVQQAQCFLSAIKNLEADCKYVVDVEGSWTVNQASTSTRAFVDYLISKGKEVAIYTGDYFYRDNLNPSVKDLPLWVASYGGTVLANSYVGLQYSETGKLEGINGNVDLDNFSDGILLNAVISTTTNSTLKAQITALQYNLNLDYNAKLKYIDGNIHQELLDNLEAAGKLIVKGHKSHVVQWVQQKLIGYGYLKKGQDSMIYDEVTFQAVTNMQKAWNRETSGKILVSNNTWQIFLNN